MSTKWQNCDKKMKCANIMFNNLMHSPRTFVYILKRTFQIFFVSASVRGPPHVQGWHLAHTSPKGCHGMTPSCTVLQHIRTLIHIHNTSVYSHILRWPLFTQARGPRRQSRNSQLELHEYSRILTTVPFRVFRARATGQPKRLYFHECRQQVWHDDDDGEFPRRKSRQSTWSWKMSLTQPGSPANGVAQNGQVARKPRQPCGIGIDAQYLRTSQQLCNVVRF